MDFRAGVFHLYGGSPYLLQAGRRRAYEDNLSIQNPGRNGTVEDVGCRNVTEGPGTPPEPQEQVAHFVERNPRPPHHEEMPGDAVFDENLLDAPGLHDGGQGEARKVPSLVFDYHGHPPDNAVPVRRGVEKTRAGHRPGQYSDVADHVAGDEELLSLPPSLPLPVRHLKGVQHAPLAVLPIPLEDEFR